MYQVEQYLVGKMVITCQILIFGHTVIRESDIYNANSVVMAATDFAQGAAVGLLLMGTIMLSRYGNKIRKFKQRLLKKGVE